MEAELVQLLEQLGLSRYKMVCSSNASAPHSYLKALRTASVCASNYGLHVQVFEEEAITDIELLISMGPEGFLEAMDELGMDQYAIASMKDELFPKSMLEDELTLEENDDDDIQLEARSITHQS